MNGPAAGRSVADPLAGQHQWRGRWRVSPLLPFTAVVLLAALWALSAFGGWAAAAFCSDRGLGAGCRAHVVAAVHPSVLPASTATALAAAAVLAPLARPSATEARIRLFAISAACWVLALGVLFVAGQVAAG